MVAQVEGVRETLAVLNSVDKDLKRQALKEIKAPAIPVAAALKATAPAAPLSGMGGYGPTKASANYGGRAYSDGSYPLVKIRLTGPGWTVASDMARNATPGESMVPNLMRKWGAASRWAWPTVEARRAALTVAVVQAALKVQREADARMRTI